MLTRLVLILRPMVVAPGQVVLAEDDFGNEMYIVISGELELTRGDAASANAVFQQLREVCLAREEGHKCATSGSPPFHRSDGTVMAAARGRVVRRARGARRRPDLRGDRDRDRAVRALPTHAGE